jgi:hypothetical protein
MIVLQHPVTFYAIVFLFYIKPRVTFKGGSPPSIPNPPFFLASPNLGTRFLLRVVVCNIPRFYQSLEGNFCAFVLLRLIENSQEFKTFWVYCKNYFKLSTISRRVSLRKWKNSKYYFLPLFKLMQACLQKSE